MEVDIICNGCKMIIKTVEKDTWDLHHKDYCNECMKGGE